MRNGNNGPTKISRSWESRGVYSGKGLLQLLAVVLASLLIVSSALAGELGALCSAAKDFVTAAKAQEGILITYPTPAPRGDPTVAVPSRARGLAQKDGGWENLQEIRWVIKDTTGIELPPQSKRPSI